MRKYVYGLFNHVRIACWLYSTKHKFLWISNISNLCYKYAKYTSIGISTVCLRNYSLLSTVLPSYIYRIMYLRNLSNWMCLFQLSFWKIENKTTKERTPSRIFTQTYTYRTEIFLFNLCAKNKLHKLMLLYEAWSCKISSKIKYNYIFLTQ